MFKHTLVAIAVAVALGAPPAHAGAPDAIKLAAKAPNTVVAAVAADLCKPHTEGRATLGTDDELAAYEAIRKELRNANVGFCKTLAK